MWPGEWSRCLKYIQGKHTGCWVYSSDATWGCVSRHLGLRGRRRFSQSTQERFGADTVIYSFGLECSSATLSIEVSLLNLKEDEAAERSAEQRRGGLCGGVCRKHVLTEWSFCTWRRRLQETRPVRFAPVEGSLRGSSVQQ